MPDGLWADYDEKMRHLGVALNLVDFHVEETNKATRLTAYHVQDTVDNVREYLTKAKLRITNELG